MTALIETPSYPENTAATTTTTWPTATTTTSTTTTNPTLTLVPNQQQELVDHICDCSRDKDCQDNNRFGIRPAMESMSAMPGPLTFMGGISNPGWLVVAV